MGTMPIWEYAEVFWDSTRRGATWYGPNGANFRYKSAHGLEMLQVVGRDGWEVVGYASAPERPGEWAGIVSKCLLRRLIQ